MIAFHNYVTTIENNFSSSLLFKEFPFVTYSHKVAQLDGIKTTNG